MKTHSRSRRSALLALALLLLVACGSSSTGSANSDRSPIQIGIMLELSGPFAANGTNIENGWKLAAQELGDTVDGRKVVGIFSDEQGDPNIALSQARQLIQQDNVALLEGPTAANTAAAVISFTGPLGVPVDDVSLCSAQQYNAYKKYGNAFASAWTCDQPALIAAKYAYDSGYRKITTIGLDYAFGWESVGSFAATFEKAGGKIEKELWAPTSTTDWAPYMTQIPSDTDAVFALVAGAISITFTTAYQQFGLKGKIPLLGTTTLTDQSILPHANASAMIGVRVAAQYCDGIDNPTNVKFVSDYEAKYNLLPGYYAETGYTKYERVIAALKKLHGNTADKKALAAALQSVKLTLPRGPVSLSPVTHSPIQNIYICQVEQKNGVLHEVPIQTFENVQPWGSLGQAAWTSLFLKDSASRPVP